MTASLGPDTVHLFVIAACAAVLLLLLQRLPYIGRIVRLLVACVLIGLALVLVLERAPYDPFLARLASRFNLDGQRVSGNAVRIRMAPNGHFWANVQINGVRRRMLIDSGATVTAISERTASEAGLDPKADILPVMLQTANGLVEAQTATVGELRLGDITAYKLKVVVSPSFGAMDVLGMNFLSKLKSWRVEDGTLILMPHHPQPAEMTSGRAGD